MVDRRSRSLIKHLIGLEPINSCFEGNCCTHSAKDVLSLYKDKVYALPTEMAYTALPCPHLYLIWTKDEFNYNYKYKGL